MKPKVANQQESSDSMAPRNDMGPSPVTSVGGNNWHGRWAQKNPPQAVIM